MNGEKGGGERERKRQKDRQTCTHAHTIDKMIELETDR